MQAGAEAIDGRELDVDERTMPPAFDGKPREERSDDQGFDGPKDVESDNRARQWLGRNEAVECKGQDEEREREEASAEVLDPSYLLTGGDADAEGEVEIEDAEGEVAEPIDPLDALGD